MSKTSRAVYCGAWTQIFGKASHVLLEFQIYAVQSSIFRINRLRNAQKPVEHGQVGVGSNQACLRQCFVCNFNRCSVARGGGMAAVTMPQSLPPAASEHAAEIATSPVTSIVAAPVPSMRMSGQRMVRAGRLRLRPRRRVLLCVLGKVEVETVVASREALRKNVSKCKRLAT